MRRPRLAFILALPLLAQDAQVAEKPSPVPSHSAKQARARALEQRRYYSSLPLPSPLLLSASEAGSAVFYLTGKRRKKGEQGPMIPQPEGEYTGEHPYYPFGSLVRVTNTVNSREITVKITGRISSSARYVIAVDDRAARALDFFRDGVGQVRLELMKKPE